jgi:CarD family transcriptional regulator
MAKTATKKKAVKPAAKKAKAAPKKSAPKAAAKKPAMKTPVKTAKDVKSAKPANGSVKPAKITKMTKPEPEVKATAKTVTVAAATKVAPKNDNKVLDFKAGDKVVYPAHGVGRVEGIEKLTAGGIEVTLYTITFEKDRMRLKLPLQKVATSGLRRLATKEQLAEVYQTMKGRARIRRVMWSRRAQEYEAKINSGSPIQVAEVLRDLKRNVSSTEHSYSERQIFQQALERLASELAAIENTAQDVAAEKLQTMLVEA